jgi:two-component system OmpR family sensor kinase
LIRVPLKVRLTLVFGVAMAIVLVGLGGFIYVRLGDELLASLDFGLRSRAAVVEEAVARGDQSLIDDKSKLLDPDEAFAQVLDASGQIVEASSAVSDAPLLSTDEVASISEPTFMSRQVSSFDDMVRLLALPVGKAAGKSVVVVGTNEGDIQEAGDRLLFVMATVGPAALLLTLAAGWLLARAALRPVEDLRREAAAISASEPSRRLRVPRTGDELARLAATLNAMLDRLQEALERERRFVDDASHELRTPLATLRGEIELALSRQHTAPELESSLRGAQEDVNHLQRLADALLVLARSRGGRIPVRRVATPLNELVARSVKSVDAQASAGEVIVKIDAPSDKVKVDPERVEQALRNLLENAIRKTPKGGSVRVGARRGIGTVRFVVEDSGPGFPPALLRRAFLPFTRQVDRNDGHGGAGLGLAIVRAVAQAHGGTARAENTPAGARVTLTLRT